MTLSGSQRRLWFGGFGILLLLGVGGYFYCFEGKEPATPPSAQAPADPVDIVDQVHQFCGSCHEYPSPKSFPKMHWRAEVERGYRFFEASALALNVPPIDAVVRYYESRAPEDFPPAEIKASDAPLTTSFERKSFPGPAIADWFAISNVNLVHLPRPGGPVVAKAPLDVLACDMKSGLVMLLRPYEASPSWTILANHAENKVAPSNPAHTEVVDLDGDGILDILVADLGSFPPTDLHCGRAIWLRGKADGTFTPIALLENVARVADVQAADFRGMGKTKLDVIVAVFGWQASRDQGAGVFFLENQTTDWNKPNFVARRIDERHGAIHVPVADLNGDGKPDFVALFAQEHEAIVAFINEGEGKFKRVELFHASDPTYGSSGIQLVDLNGDNQLDVLYTNGDTLDQPYLFKPYHGVQWLENKGDLQFEHHPITPMYGVHRAVAGDLLGNHRQDVVAVSFLPRDKFPERSQRKADGIIILERTQSGEYRRHSLTTVDCDHTTCALGDVFGTGRLDIVVGNFSSASTMDPVTIWKNLGKK
jgi:hypothetical protein